VHQTVFSLGHSNHELDAFVDLLRLHEIEMVCDVRSHPYSRFHSQFNRESLEARLRASGIAYLFLGAELGARSTDPSCLERGKVRYDRLAATEAFQRGIERIRRESEDHRLALVCAEKEPLECHRTILVARHLDARGLDIQHIHADGSLESHDKAIGRLLLQLKLPERDLFRSRDDVIADAYAVQGARIAYEPTAPESEVAAG
jgi:uncharacterized protein (DUF488 family)